MTSKKRLLALLALGIGLASFYSFLLHVLTEPWRVYGNDHLQILWATPVFLSSAVIAFFGSRHQKLLPAFWLLIPLFFIALHQIKTKRLRDAATSCANHSAFWAPMFGSIEPLPASTDFADFLLAINSSAKADRLESFACPGFKRVGTKTGIVFVGGGLRPESIRGPDVLIAFCSWQSHPPPHDHQHCLMMHSGQTGGTNWATFQRECSDTSNTIARIERALQQATNGAVPYSPAARQQLADELENRKRMLALLGYER